jgi:hypothetical protein
VRAFKGIICTDVFEFESYHASQAVQSRSAMSRSQEFVRHSRFTMGGKWLAPRALGDGKRHLRSLCCYFWSAKLIQAKRNPPWSHSSHWPLWRSGPAHGRSFADRADAGQHIFDLGRRDPDAGHPAGNLYVANGRPRADMAKTSVLLAPQVAAN